MPSTQIRQTVIRSARRIVVKIGTNALTDGNGRLDEAFLRTFCGQISRVIAQGRSVTLVSSGAIGAGMAELDLPGRPKTLPLLQATAAVGQGQLMRTFHDAFAAHGLKVAQILVTRDDFQDRTRYLNIRNTIVTLADYGVVPVINENDAVAVDELRFGDNDIIAALLTTMLRAELLVLLSNVDGVMKDGSVLDVIDEVNPSSLSLATAGRSRLGSGGMTSKMSSAGMVTKAGDVVVVANARAPEVLERLLAGEKVGTVFVPAARRLSGRRSWIGQASRPAGRVVLDDGAARAILQSGKSLLPSGITAVTGRFAKGATVLLVDASGRQLARGLTNYSAEQIDKIKGLKTAQIARVLGEKPYDEVIHRNNMTLL